MTMEKKKGMRTLNILMLTIYVLTVFSWLGDYLLVSDRVGLNINSALYSWSIFPETLSIICLGLMVKPFLGRVRSVIIAIGFFFIILFELTPTGNTLALGLTRLMS